jgi:hypothetical protein
MSLGDVRRKMGYNNYYKDCANAVRASLGTGIILFISEA